MKIILRFLLIGISVAIVIILLWASLDKLVKLHAMDTQSVTFAEGSIEDHYRDHLLLGYVHIVAGIVFLVLGAHQIIPFIRSRNYKRHRILGKVFLLLSALIFVTAIVLGLFYPFGNWLESVVTVVFGSFLLFCTYKAYMSARRQQFHAHRNWVTRLYFIAIAVSTVRGIIALFMATSETTVQEIFGMAFLMAFVAHFLLVEIWIKYLAR